MPAGHADGRRPLSQPTRALPGTEDKVLVLIARLGRGEELWHPDDSPLVIAQNMVE
jgi:hypothetical protein